jgi:hypothetical protein
MTRSILILLVVLATPALAQTWFKVATESPTLSLTMQAGTTYRMGNATNEAWSSNQVVATPLTISVYYPTMTVAFPDPAPGVSKEIDVLETAVVSTVTLTDTSVAPAKVTVVAIPALAPISYPPIAFTPGTVYPLAFTNILVIPNSPAAALLDVLPIPGWEFYAALLQNFTSTFLLSGVTFNCTYGGAMTTGKVNLNCVPAPVAAK